MLDGLGAADQHGVGGLRVTEVLEILGHLFRDALHGLAGLGAGSLADDLEDLLQALDLVGAFLAMRLEDLLQLGMLGSLGGLAERARALLLGPIDVLQGLVEGVAECLFLGGHDVILFGLNIDQDGGLGDAETPRNGRE